jgi:hypothetical protein
MSKKPDTASRMADILAANRLAELRGPEAPPSPAPVETPLPRAPKPISKPSPKPEVSPVESETVGRRGRPLGSKTGKKSDEEYCPTTIYIRKETRKRVKQALLYAESTEDVSELVEGLLQDWLDKTR